MEEIIEGQERLDNTIRLHDLKNNLFLDIQGSHRLEKYLNIEGFLEKYLKIKSALKSAGKLLKGLEKPLSSTL